MLHLLKISVHFMAKGLLFSILSSKSFKLILIFNSHIIPTITSFKVMLLLPNLHIAVYYLHRVIVNLLLTEGEGCTGEYWPELSRDSTDRA